MTTIRIAKGLYKYDLDAYRIYRRDNKGHYILVAWMDRRCIICGRFLNKKQHLYCAKHVIISKKKYLMSNEVRRRQNFKKKVRRVLNSLCNLSQDNKALDRNLTQSLN